MVAAPAASALLHHALVDEVRIYILIDEARGILLLEASF